MEIRFGPENTDFDTVHPWLASTDWSPGTSRETVERAARHSSLVVNAWEDGRQIGYCRVVSDRTTFAWLSDVFVTEAARGKGVARAMISAALDHREHQGLRRWVLATKDAHDLYARLGFEPLQMPEHWMVRLP
jgi:GNAT superfamily N-acetyltransferase